ncbi:unnamed protein product [Protopolystoma xenopodis]|uniref:Uncharacterized protein n=1 Tax=Protopolystoma xenopodis TaxID=117903 RepID=A0A3S5BSY7_9PLAT|nr:unnamed protein product [Protopolystoma xenopodis]
MLHSTLRQRHTGSLTLAIVDYLSLSSDPGPALSVSFYFVEVFVERAFRLVVKSDLNSLPFGRRSNEYAHPQPSLTDSQQSEVMLWSFQHVRCFLKPGYVRIQTEASARIRELIEMIRNLGFDLKHPLPVKMATTTAVVTSSAMTDSGLFGGPTKPDPAGAKSFLLLGAALNKSQTPGGMGKLTQSGLAGKRASLMLLYVFDLTSLPSLLQLLTEKDVLHRAAVVV